MFIVFCFFVCFWISVISNTEEYMPGQFMKQESCMGLNLIHRTCSSIIDIQQIARILCKKNSSIRETLTLLTNLFGVSKKHFWGR